MRQRIVVAGMVAGFFLLVALAVYIAHGDFDTTLDFSLQDAVSRGWVWDATIKLQNRTIRAFYQSDRGLREYQFTTLSHGESNLEISAPGYASRTIPVSLKRGANRIDVPIGLTGVEIPDLQYFIPVETWEGSDIRVELRPVGSDGRAIVNHPCLDIWIGVRVTVQMTSDGVALEPSDSGASRGEELFRGHVAWEWDGSPETVFRYSALVPGADIRKRQAPYRVFDYLFVVPEPSRTGGKDIEAIVNKAWKNTDPADLRSVLDGYSDQFSYSIYTSWNVGVSQ